MFSNRLTEVTVIAKNLYRKSNTDSLTLAGSASDVAILQAHDPGGARNLRLTFKITDEFLKLFMAARFFTVLLI